MHDIYLLFLICAALTIVSVFTSVIAFRFGAPLLLLFLAIGLVAGENGPGGIRFDDASATFLVGSAALALILFDSGFHTKLRTYRQAAAPAMLLASIGVLLTTAIVTVADHVALGQDWPHALLIGTILSSTDAAALFFLLRVGGITIREHVRSTLEVESGINDPVAIFLVLTAVDLISGKHAGSWVNIVADLLLQMGGGAFFGVIGGLAIVLVVNRVRLEPGLTPVVVMAFALAIFALANLLDCSGFLAAYLAGLIAGNARLQSVGAVRRFQDGLIWLAQIAMFVMLGLLATPARFPAISGRAFLLALVLTFVARPIAVFLCLWPLRFTLRERAFIAWVGLRGAVSILLALVPLLANIPDAQDMFDIAFVVVVISLLAQGWTVRPLARLLRLIVPLPTGPVNRMEVDLPGLADHELVAYQLHPGSAAIEGETLPRWARPILVRRGKMALTQPRALMAGDRVFMLATLAQLPLLDRLFGQRQQTLAEADDALYGDFIVGADITLGALRATYGLPPGLGDDHATLADLFIAAFHNDLEPGDRLHLGPVDLIVRDLNDGRVVSVGIALEPVIELGLRQRTWAWFTSLLRAPGESDP
jgi:cell volume regulation protein A